MAEMHIVALRATAILSIILWLKVVVFNFGLGFVKMKSGGRAPEDDQANADAVTSEALAKTDRSQRIVNNDLENIPYTLILAWGAMFCIFFGTNEDFRDSQALAQIVLLSIFCVARVLHSFIYLKGLSVPRSFAFLFGLCASFGIAINGLIAAFMV